jgi:hypothetical protein
MFTNVMIAIKGTKALLRIQQKNKKMISSVIIADINLVAEEQYAHIVEVARI